MKYSLLELRKYQGQTIQFDQVLDIKEMLISRDEQILNLSLVKVTGSLEVKASEYFVHYHVQTTITLPSSRSLIPVDVPLSFDVDELFMTPEQFRQKDELIADEEVLILETQTLDLVESVVDNLLLAIPIQVLSEEELNTDEMPSGKDWQVISEEDYFEKKQSANERNLDPRLAKLSLLFENEEEDA